MEEYQIIAGTSTTLATPAAPSVTIRNAQSNETALGTTIQDVAVAATNYFGTTAVSSQTSISAITTGQVVDVTISPVAGATQYNIWGYDGSTNWYLLATCGGVKFTLQGPLPAIGTHPTTDSGTGKPTRMEGVIPIAVRRVRLRRGSTRSGWQGGYSNFGVGLHLNYNTIYTAIKALWDSTTTSPGAFKADPAEIISSGSDIANLSQDVISQGSAANYELFIKQGEVGDVTVGAAVSQFQNPLTRSLMKMVVHPFYQQGNAELLSYQLPQSVDERGKRVGMSHGAGLCLNCVARHRCDL